MRILCVADEFFFGSFNVLQKLDYSKRKRRTYLYFLWEVLPDDYAELAIVTKIYL